MECTVEISINLHKHRQLDSIKQTITEKLGELQCESHYWFHERDDTDFKRNKSRLRNNYVGCISFLPDHIDNASRFISYIKQLDGVYIDCVYEDDIIPKLLYASPFYLKKANKGPDACIQSQQERKNAERARKYPTCELIKEH